MNSTFDDNGLLGSGRGGTCELMIGCIAKATSDTLHMDESEMDDVRWVGRDQLKKAVEDSKRKDTPYQGQPNLTDSLHAGQSVSVLHCHGCTDRVFPFKFVQ